MCRRANDGYASSMTTTLTAGAVIGPRWEWGDRLRKVRRSIAGLSQAEMAAVIGVKAPTYASWEGGYTQPSLRMAKAVAHRIEAHYPQQVSAAWMLGVADDNAAADVDLLAPAPPDGFEPSTVRLSASTPLVAPPDGCEPSTVRSPHLTGNIAGQNRLLEILCRDQKDLLAADACVSKHDARGYDKDHVHAGVLLQTWGGLSA